MLAVTAEQMRKIDALCISEYGIPGIVLMENAAAKVAGEVMKFLKTLRSSGSNEKIRYSAVVFAGTGNNGGDAFAAARHLMNNGVDVIVRIVGDRSRIKGEALTNLDILRKMGPVISDYGAQGLKTIPGGTDIILDGIFGTGFKGSLQGAPADAVNEMNASGIPIVSIDIPSGLNADNGKATGPCVKATRTVTLGLLKIGLVVLPGCEYAGELIVADISIPSAVVERIGIKSHIIDFETVKRLFNKRPAEANKGVFGKAVIFAGSYGMTGAGCLAAEAMLRVGAGLAYAVVPASLASNFNNTLKELITIPIDDTGSKGYLPAEICQMLPGLLQGKSAAAAGPGLSTVPSVSELVKALVKTSTIPLVLDADALNVLEGDTGVLSELRAEAVLTPHPGEMARLAGISTAEVQQDRIGTALAFASEHKVILVLKGARTIIADPEGRFFINTTGNPGMATGGSGDILTGMITGLAAQGFSLLDASVAAVFLHGLAGDLASMEKGEYGMIAGDILGYLPEAILEVMGL